MTTSIALEQEEAPVSTTRLLGGDVTRSLHEGAFCLVTYHPDWLSGGSRSAATSGTSEPSASFTICSP